jgi:hypothetical protein
VNKVELFNLIRREYFLNKKSIRWLAKESKVHRRMVRQAITNAVPPKRAINVRSSKQL